MRENLKARNSSNVAIVIPTYNESKNLRELIAKIDEVVGKEVHIIVIDDNSPDGTGKLADEVASLRGNMDVIHRPSKLGLGSAYRTGFKLAIEGLGADILVEMDADLSHEPGSLKSLIGKVEDGYDLVIGSRNVQGGNVVDMSPGRRLMSWGGNFLGRNFAGLRVRDSTSGFRAYSSKGLQQINFMNVKSEGFSFQVEMVYDFQRRGLKIREAPITYVFRKAGKSKLMKREILGFIKTIIRLTARRLLGR